MGLIQLAAILAPSWLLTLGGPGGGGELGWCLEPRGPGEPDLFSQDVVERKTEPLYLWIRGDCRTPNTHPPEADQNPEDNRSQQKVKERSPTGIKIPVYLSEPDTLYESMPLFI